MTDHKPRLPALRAGNAIAPIIPSSFEEAYRFGQAVVAAQMAPKSVNTAEKAMVAILHGMEVGLTPMAALQSIAVVNGMPTIWGDGALALVRNSGELVSIKEWLDGPEGKETAHCRIVRLGYEDEPTEQSFSHQDAVVSGLINKDGPWKLYPKRMKQMRARSWAMRDAFADVLRGLRITEEAQDIPAEIITEDGEVLSRPAQILAQRMAAKAEAATVEAEFNDAVDPPAPDVVDDPAPEPEADPPAAIKADPEPQEQAAQQAAAEAATEADGGDYGATWFVDEVASLNDWPGIEQALTRLRKSPAWVDGGPALQAQVRRIAFQRLLALVEAGYAFDFLTNAQAWRCYLEVETDLSKANFCRDIFLKEPAWTNLSTPAKIQLDDAWAKTVERIKRSQDAPGEDSGRGFL